ncbi:MAG: phage major capsid protein [Burkholderiales bacterium]
MARPSIQDLREERYALAARARAMLDGNAGDKWTPTVARQVDDIYEKIEALDRDIRREERRIEAGAGGAHGRGEAELFDAKSGRAIPVARAGDDFRIALGDAFQNSAPSGERHGLGEFLRGIAGMKTHESVRNALSTGTDSAGGYALPQYLQLDMLQALVPTSSLLQAGAGVAVLDDGAGGGSKSWRIAAINAIPTAAWRSEGGTVATSDPTFRNVDLVPRSLAFQFKVSRELLADAVNLEPALKAVIGQAFAREIDRAGLRGSGTPPEIRGILNTSGIQSVTNGANGASLGTTAYANFITAMNSILAADGPMPTAAIMAPRSLTTLAGLLDTTNQPRRVPPAIEKWQFIPTSQIPTALTVGTSNDCSELYVGDFSKVIFFLREGVAIQKLTELYAATGEVGFVAHVRVDVGVLYPAAMAVVTGVRA